MNKHFNQTNKKKFDRDGYVILYNLISKKTINKIKSKVYELYEWESKKGKSYIYKFDKSKKTKRVWNLINKSALFRNLIQNKEVNNFMEWIFDRKTVHQKYFLSSFQANILEPGADIQKLHIDTPVPEPLPSWPIKANSIWMIDDFTTDNGSTEVLPKSHKFKFKPNKMDNKNKKIIKCIGPAGSVIITHGALWHRAGGNKSNENRLALLGSFAASYAKEISNEEDQSKVVDEFTIKRSTPFLKKILGFGHGIKEGSLIKPKIRD
mgnify:FL=1